MPRNFDFEGHIDDDNRNETSDVLGNTEHHVTVEGLLKLKFGKLRGKAIYRELQRVAFKAAETNGGEPGLIFDEKGGHFVSFHRNDLE